MLQIQMDMRTGGVGSQASEATAARKEGYAAACTTGTAGDWVEVRSKEEILATLDARGRLDGMPFMPEMLRFCGQQFQVFKRAHKTCDTISGAYTSRSVPESLHLDLRCDGSAHGGCQAGCLLFWKGAWLKPVPATECVSHRKTPRPAGEVGCTEKALQAATQHASAGPKPRYACQTTEVFSYSKPLPWWDARQYVEDYTSGNISLKRLIQGATFSTFMFATQARRRTLGKPGRWLYDRIQSILGGMPYPRSTGIIPTGAVTPREDLGLQPGDLVRVKSLEAIQKTIDGSGRNRNMDFDAELVPYCGKMFRVRTRVERFVDERSGEMRSMKTPAVILEGVYCQSCYSKNRLFCPRSIYSWWREIWLERVPDGEAG